jgi:AcrR family transcriptional regulator
MLEAVMATRSYTASRRRGRPASIQRVLDASERLIREDAFHTATMDELAAAAGVSRATVFNRFGSKLGVLQALFDRCLETPEMEAVLEAFTVEDPVVALDAVVDTSCAMWEGHGFIVEQIEAIAILEPEASAMLKGQWDDQRAALQGLTRRLARAGRLRPRLGETRATATLHMLTSLESFFWLRREYGLSLRQTRDTITELARQVLSDYSSAGRAGP